MSTICGANCDLCSLRETCRGCAETCGRPFGGACLAAESIKAGGKERFAEQKRQLISQFNALGIEGMPEITELFCLCGSFVNLAYPMPNGRQVQLLDDKTSISARRWKERGRIDALDWSEEQIFSLSAHTAREEPIPSL